MNRHRTPLLVARTAALLAALAVLPAVAAQADPVGEWNAIARQVVLAEKANALVQSRVMALLHGAVFDAVNGITRRYQPYRATPEPASGAVPEAAASAAAHRVLSALYPAQQTLLDRHYQHLLGQIAESAGKTAGVEFGRQVADAMLAWRADDGAGATVDYTPNSGPGVWTPAAGQAPVGAHWGRVRPWLLQSAVQFRPAPPPALDSAVYRADYDEVETIGAADSSQRSAEQSDGARFWIQSGVLGWNPTAIELAARKGLDLVDNARLLALLSMATADALIACYEAKYHYNFWRPANAISSADRPWETAVPTPPFPAYPSGHACFGGAAAAVLEAEFGADEFPEISLTSATAPGVVRRYRRLQQQLDDISNARIWGGIHWRFDQTVGERLGRQVGDYALHAGLRPVGS